MTTFDRFERQIPELMTELAPARVPDYFDDMLRQTGRTRQRPAWSYPERWLPVEITARPLTTRSFPWRPLVVVALIAMLIAAGLAAYIGSQDRLPPPFGVARNGAIVFGVPDGDIVRFDPVTRETAPLVAGPTRDGAPGFAPDGRRLIFMREVVPGGASYFIADADGSNVRQLVAPPVEWFEWARTSDRIVVGHVVDGLPRVSVVDVASGASSELAPGLGIESGSWRPNEELVATAPGRGLGAAARAIYVVRPDETERRVLVEDPTMINTPAISPDGSRIAYTTWESAAEGRTHIIDIDSGDELAVDFDPGFAFTDLNPQFSPDGSKLLIERYDVDGYRLTIVPVEGGGSAVALGTHRPEMSNGAIAMFSPDGTKVLATYQNDGTTWLYDVATGAAEEIPSPIPLGTAGSWQRLAP